MPFLPPNQQRQNTKGTTIDQLTVKNHSSTLCINVLAVICSNHSQYLVDLIVSFLQRLLLLFIKLSNDGRDLCLITQNNLAFLRQIIVLSTYRHNKFIPTINCWMPHNVWGQLHAIFPDISTLSGRPGITVNFRTCINYLDIYLVLNIKSVCANKMMTMMTTSTVNQLVKARQWDGSAFKSVKTLNQFPKVYTDNIHMTRNYNSHHTHLTASFPG